MPPCACRSRYEPIRRVCEDSVPLPSAPRPSILRPLVGLMLHPQSFFSLFQAKMVSIEDKSTHWHSSAYLTWVTAERKFRVQNQEPPSLLNSALVEFQETHVVLLHELGMMKCSHTLADICPGPVSGRYLRSRLFRDLIVIG